MKKQKGKGVRILHSVLLVLLGILCFSNNQVQAGIASSYTDAREFYESTGVEKPYHADENAGCIYFATKAKLAAHEGKKYATIGYDISMSANGKTVSFRVKRNGDGSVQEVPGSRREYNGYEYNLYKLSEKELIRLANKINATDTAKIFESRYIKVQIDAIMTIKENNILLGDVMEDGAGGLKETGDTNKIYNLKNDEEWKALRKVFPNHDFFSFRNIELNLNNYRLYVSYNLAGGTVNKNYSIKENILYQNEKRYVTSATILQEIQLLKPEDIGLEKTGFHIEEKKEWKTAEQGILYSVRKKYLPKEICVGIGDGDQGVIMVANWQANTYEIVYDVNGGLGVFQKQSTEYGKSEALHKIIPEKPGNAFKGWKCDGAKCENCKKNRLHEPGETIKNLTDIHGATVKLTAQWENKMVQIKTDKQQGKNGTNLFFERYGIGWYADKKGTDLLSTITIPSFSGYSFEGYYTGIQGYGKLIVDKYGTIVAATDTFKEDSIIYAKWEPAKYHITFKKHGGVGGQNGSAEDDIVEAFYG